MAERTAIELKLSKVLTAIYKADNVAQKVKDQLNGVTFEDEAVELDKDRMLSVYQLRYNILLSGGKKNQGWADLLDRLALVDSNEPLKIVLLRKGEEVMLVFIDKDYRECFGIISSFGA